MSTLGRFYYSVCRNTAGHSLARSVVGCLRSLGALRGFRMPLDALGLDHAAVGGLMRLWSRIHWSSGDGMMPPQQLLEVYRLAATWPVKGDIVELGAWVGLTTSYLATACGVRGEGKVHAVDTFEGTKEGDTTYPSVAKFGGSTLDAFRDQIARAGVEKTVNTLIGDTKELARAYSGDPIRMLFIDADHSYEGVRGDFESWLSHVGPGGVVVFRDYEMPEVARFVDDDVCGDIRVEMTPGHVVANVVAVTKIRQPSGRCRRPPHNAVPADAMEAVPG